MKAVAYRQSLAIEHPDSLIDCELPDPEPGPEDLLIRVKAIAVNPVDCKIRNNVAPPPGELKVLGWDASGEVVAVGEKVSDFTVGDRVFYAGDLNRQGCNAELQAVDARLVGRMPQSLSFAEAAALPLTSITAWELIFDRLGIQTLASGAGNTEPLVLVTGAAGGVGSIAVQLLKQLTAARVVATASRPESADWVRSLGADAVINHHDPLPEQYRALNWPELDYVLSLTHTDKHYASLCEIMKPQSRFGLIDDPLEMDIKAFKRKSISLHWEFMYTRSMFQTDDMAEQGALLNRVAELVDNRQLRTTMGENLGRVSSDTLKRAHAMMEAHEAIGKVVLEFS